MTAHLLTVIVISAVLTGCGPRRTKQGSSPSTDGQSTVGADSEAGSDDGPDVHRTRPTSESRAIDGRFFGYNAASIVQPVNVELMFDPALTTELAKFPVDLIRIPSGTAAQWLDWRTGRFIASPDSPFVGVSAERRPTLMSDWQSWVERSGATPVWDLNVLNSDLQDQIAMLEEAERLGMPVEFIELGNELWDPRSIYPDRFGSGGDYARAMNEWIPALQERFPTARIAVSGANLADEVFTAALGPRFNNWNHDVVSTITNADAIAIHPYWTLPNKTPPGSDINATLTSGLDHWRAFETTTLDQLPKGLEVWLTEWNQGGHFVTSGTQVWAQALSVVAVAIEQLLDPRVTMSLIHNIVDGTSNPHDIGVSTVFPSFTNGHDGTPRLARTALGHALPILFSAVPSGSRVRRLVVDGVERVGDHPGVSAVLISGKRPGALLVNLTAAAVRVATPSTLGRDAEFKAVSAQTDAQPGWVATDSVKQTSGSSASTTLLPPYSVTYISGG
ncbi:MAG: hypothetical protein KDB26_02970 [Microthrixaceae bacterium]|nr:hypothetical protein [Microthrixaceae bacterium]